MSVIRKFLDAYMIMEWNESCFRKKSNTFNIGVDTLLHCLKDDQNAIPTHEGIIMIMII